MRKLIIYLTALVLICACGGKSKVQKPLKEYALEHWNKQTNGRAYKEVYITDSVVILHGGNNWYGMAIAANGDTVEALTQKDFYTPISEDCKRLNNYMTGLSPNFKSEVLMGKIVDLYLGFGN
jgi:hypothetical protein